LIFKRRDGDSGAIPILTYHSLDTTGSVISVHPDRFARHMACLDTMGHRAASLREVTRHFRDFGRWPERTVALTFDDGYENLHRHALPTLARHGYTATAFLVSGYMGGQTDWESPPAKLGVQAVLDWGQAAEMSQAGWEIGAHTHTHPDLRTLTTEQVEGEVIRCRRELEDRLGVTVDSFAYPYGYTSEDAASIVAREFEVACLTELRTATSEDFHSLPRIDAYYLQKPDRLKRLLNGRLDRYVTIRRWGRRLRG